MVKESRILRRTHGVKVAATKVVLKEYLNFNLELCRKPEF